MMDWDDDIVIQPRRLKKESAVPETGLLLVNPSEARYGFEAARLAGAEQRILYNSNLCVNESRGYFVAGPAIGAPLAVLTLEKLIALGARRIVLFGWCGSMNPSLSVGDFLLPARAVSGEGTSAYYVSGDQPGPSISLVKLLKNIMEQENVSSQEGCVWSTDAPYREKRSYLKMLRDHQRVDAVDMEFSALCSAAFFREVDFAALLLVSDEVWGKEWTPGFSRQEFKNKSKLMIDTLLRQMPFVELE